MYDARTVRVYAADFEYTEQDAPRSYRVMTQQFTAPSPIEAIEAAARFWNGRVQAWPEYFGTLLCLKIRTLTIGPIDAEGRAGVVNNFPFFEFKIDTAGMPFSEYVGFRSAQLKRIRGIIE